MTEFHPPAPEIKYFQDDKNTCCFSSLESYLFASRGYLSEQAILLYPREYLKFESKRYKDMINFGNDIMIDKKETKVISILFIGSC